VLYPERQNRRALGAVFTIVLLTAALLTAFFHTQVLAGERFAARSEDNRSRALPMPAPRGTVYDRNREVVATSTTAYTVSLLPGERAVFAATLRDLAPFLGLSGARVREILRARDERPHDMVDVTRDATFAQVAALEERRSSFPSLLVTERPRRHYPAGPAVAHLMGYVGEITEEELRRPGFAGYRQGEWIGKSGIERRYERHLRGRAGAKLLKVDALGRVVDPGAPATVRAPVPGRDLRLTLDVELQEYVHRIFPDSMKGAVVAMVPSTGEVLALYSNPTFDPNTFSGGVPAGVWRALNHDPNKPLLNRAIGALYPPASTFKLATAAAGLRAGAVDPAEFMPEPCDGGMYYAGRHFSDWYAPPGFGSLDLGGAITHSCNVYFYQVGIRLGLEKLARAGTEMGFNRPTGIDLPGEKTPVFPTGAAWYEERFGWKPTPSEVLSLAIGQGPNAQTVLKVAQFYSALAGNGTAPEPHMVAREGAGEGPGALDLGLSRTQLEELRAGLAGVTDWERNGTARLSALERWKLYGKTGTAQNPHGKDHGWFAGFAGRPGGDPEIVVVAFVEHGLHGSDVAPLAAKAAQFYLDRKYGLPVDEEPTLIERLESGRTPWASLE
jgi:penicillin-binding protein 2